MGLTKTYKYKIKPVAFHRTKWTVGRFVVKTSHSGGAGVFSTQTINSGVVVHRMSGKTVSGHQIHKLCSSGKLHRDDPLQLGHRTWLVLNKLSRSFNHGCEPNVVLRGRNLVSICQINKGEEIRYDYSLTVPPQYGFWAMICKCGAPTCRKKIKTIASLKKSRLTFYESKKAIPNWIKQATLEFNC